MGDQVPLFAGNRGCGVRDRGAAVVIIPDDGRRVVQQDLRTASLQSGEHMTHFGRCVVVRIDGVKLESPNRSATVSRGARMAQAGRTKKLRAQVKLHIIAALGLGHAPPSRVVVTRISAGELDMDNAWSSCKAVFDGVADAFNLPNDRELQKRAAVRQMKSKPRTRGVLIELFFGNP